MILKHFLNRASYREKEMLIDFAIMAQIYTILFSQFFGRLANGYMANHNRNHAYEARCLNNYELVSACD